MNIHKLEKYKLYKVILVSSFSNNARNLAALAAVAASTCAFAQSSVTLYGYGDMGVGKSVGTSEKTQFNPGTADVGGIRLGLKGSEDLGGGLKANFQLETNGINEAGVGDGGYGRAAWFGVTGGFGTLQLGRQARNSVVAAVAASPAAWRGTDPEAAVGIRYSINTNVGVSSRNSAMINYITPSFSGLTARIGYINAADNSNKSVVDAALIYANGPLTLTYGYLKAETLEGNSGVHGAYDLGVATVMASYNKRGAIPAGATTYTVTGAAGNVVTSTAVPGSAAVAGQDGFSIGAKAPLGATTVYATYAKNNDSKVDAIELGADYALSKRTALTAFAAKTKSKDAGYYVGVRHAF